MFSLILICLMFWVNISYLGPPQPNWVWIYKTLRLAHLCWHFKKSDWIQLLLRKQKCPLEWILFYCQCSRSEPLLRNHLTCQINPDKICSKCSISALAAKSAALKWWPKIIFRCNEKSYSSGAKTITDAQLLEFYLCLRLNVPDLSWGFISIWTRLLVFRLIYLNKMNFTSIIKLDDLIFF